MNTIQVSEITKKRRAQIKSLQDEFTTFSWRGLDAFENFGAFIINDKKGSLKFYNGPGFANQYTSPQFSANVGDLEGVKFNRQHITFKVGVYWITIEDYRKFLKWLDPLVIDRLNFGFDTKFGYNVKLAKISDSTRWIVGRENNQPAYYTELDLDFEIQGAQCALGQNSYEMEWSLENKNLIGRISTEHDFIQSDLPTPFETINMFNIVTEMQDADNFNFEYIIKLDAEYDQKYIDENNQEQIESQIVNLYSIEFKNLTTTFISKEQPSTPILTIGVTYHSETGLLYLEYGNSSDKILTLMTTTDTGERIVSSFSSNKFYLPGLLEDPSFDISNFRLKLSVIGANIPDAFYKSYGEKEKTYDSYFICYPRTNIV